MADANILADLITKNYRGFLDRPYVKMSDGALWSAQDFVRHYLGGSVGPLGTDSKGVTVFRERGRPVSVDATWFMAEGPGRLVDERSFSGLMRLFTRENLQDGTHSITSLMTGQERTDYLKNYTTGLLDDDHAARSYVFGTSPFLITNGEVTVRDGKVVSIVGLEISPLTDNYDYDPQGAGVVNQIINILKVSEQNNVDPYEKGKQFNIEFDGPGKIIPYAITRENIIPSEFFFRTAFLRALQCGCKTV